MSGGVDSSVAAALLLRAGYEVTGGFIKNWSDSKDPLSGVCSWRAERRDAIRVAAALDIPLLTFDFEKQYRAKIVAELYRGYAKGETPNPDVLCNEYIKFGLFFDKAKELGFDYMATGHYASLKTENCKLQTAKSSISANSNLSVIRNILLRSASSGAQAKYEIRLLRGLDPDKDQSYFLYRVPQQVLRRTLLPIGRYRKTEIRNLAKKFHLPVAEKPDSQGICFIGKVNFSKFLGDKIKSKPGNIVTPEGNIIGRHQGLHNYTIGQRQKIAVADKHPWYVAQKNPKTNELIVAPGENHPLMKSKIIILDDLHWISSQAPQKSFTAQVQIRYRQKSLPAKVSTIKGSKTVRLEFKKPVSAAAIGQSAVIYKGKECLGGGVIRQTLQM